MELISETYKDEIRNNIILNTTKNKLRKKFYCPEAIQMYMDVISVFIGYLIYYFIKFGSGWFYNINEPDSIFWIIIPEFFYLTFWLIVFWFTGLYKNWYVRSPFVELFTTKRIVFFVSFVFLI